MLAPVSELLLELENPDFRRVLCELYGLAEIDEQKKRYAALLESMKKTFGDEPAAVVSVPGRTEISGNHTDHNHGRVLAAGIQMDCVGVASPCDENMVTIMSDGYSDPIRVVLGDLSVQESETGTSAAIVRGVAAGLAKRGFNVGGFNCRMTSSIPMGTGFSSSAAFELAVASIFNHLYNDDVADNLVLAGVARDSENIHFGKPCGFMDQMACAFKGISMIDFREPESPEVTPVNCDFEQSDYRLAVVQTGGDHTDLTPEYAAITHEMKEVASILGGDVLRGFSLSNLMSALPEVRKRAGDRAVLRAIHFFEEHHRVKQQVGALEHGDFEAFIHLVNMSGDSSWRLLQNCVPADSGEQPIPLALALSRRILMGRGGVRVHGGGFAGTILVLVPVELYGEYAEGMDRVFGAGATIALRVRPAGNSVVMPMVAHGPARCRR